MTFVARALELFLALLVASIVGFVVGLLAVAASDERVSPKRYACMWVGGAIVLALAGAFFGVIL